MRIVCVGYRKWALKIYKKLVKKFSHEFLIINSKNKFNADDVIDFKPI